MKKLLMIALASLIVTGPVKANVNDALEFLEPHCNENDSIEGKEFIDETRPGSFRSLLIEYTYSPEAKEEHADLYDRRKRDNTLLEMTKQDWFDYTNIQFLRMTNQHGTGIDEHIIYMVDSGTYINYTLNHIRPWIIKTGSEIDIELKRFLGRVANELLKANGIYGNLEIGMGGEDSLDIRTCSKLATVSGTCEMDGKTYNFVTEFTFDFRSEWDGEYEAIYVGVNDVPLQGEFKDIESYFWSRDE